MACPHCGSDADWYKLEDGRSRCPDCYATSDPKGAEDDMKDQLEARDSTDKTTTMPTRIDDEVAKQQAKDTK